MNNLTNNSSERIKDVFSTPGYLHIELRDGMRLSAPIKDNYSAMMASRLVDTGPSSDWMNSPSLDHLIPEAAA
jgi:hypothetical protein